MFFALRDSEHGTEPWRTDGTPSGTRLLKDIATADFEEVASR